MQLHHSPTRLEFSAQEHNAAQRALLRLVTDFGLAIQPDKREWCAPLGTQVARIAVQTAAASSVELPLDTSVRLLAVNSAGEQLLEVLYTSLRLTWREPKNGPTYLRRSINRAQVEAVLRILS